MTGTVSVRNLEFQGNHGASADERRSTRRFQVDVDVRLDIGRAVESDRLQDTINYYDLCAMIVAIGEGSGATRGASREEVPGPSGTKFRDGSGVPSGMPAKIGEARAHRLLEAVAGSMVAAIRTRWPGVKVELELRKLHPPCPGNPDHTAVRLSAG